MVLSLVPNSFAQLNPAEMDSLDHIHKTAKKKGGIGAILTFSPYYTALMPIGELSNRFGFSNNVGMDISFKLKSNWLLGIAGDYLFGSQVKENPLAPILTQSTFQLIGNDGSLGDIPLQLSGFELAFRVGKLIPVSRKHPNSGFLISLAPGFMQHKIWMNSNTNKYYQIDPTYKTGYDRLTNGAMLRGGIGYQYIEKRRFLSFYGGIDFAIGFTQEVRNWNFDLMSADKHRRLDMLIGLKLAWIIPVFLNGKSTETYYY